MKKKETLNFRVSPEFKRRLIEEAKKERRSLTNYLEAALTNLWERQESESVAKAEGEKGRVGRRPKN
jgi:predicted transcriptional regulator